MAITLSILNGFSKFFTAAKRSKLLTKPVVKKFWKSVKNWQSCRHEFGYYFFGSSCTVVLT